ncbi:cystatin-2-like [Mobula birostris]|uniref:cystatin-2-like n=1 Tax=Mobula birostris TaxID=1983395 RepID=UPI003B287142
MGPGLLVVLVLMLTAAEVGETSMPGGLSPVATDDPGVLNATRVAEEDFNRRSNDLFHTAVSNVISAQTQVVAGLMYHLSLVLRTTVCRKAEPRLENCPFHQDPQYAKRTTCTYKVWYRPWIGRMEAHSAECSGVLK